jgi:CubicO group peptidase (beta-lactamase class C family)
MRILGLHLLALSAVLSVAGIARAEPPPALDDGWSVADPAREGFDAATLAAMEAAIAGDAAPDTTSVLIARDGRLVYERYFGKGGRDVLNDTRSATKSVTALLVGAAVDRGLIDGAHWLNADPRKLRFTVEDLLTMSSQWECDDDNQFSAGNEERMYLSADWTQFALDLPIKGYAPWMKRPEDSPHGRSFAYCTAGSFLLGAIVERVSGQPLAALAREAQEKPLGNHESQWQR